MNDTSRTKLKGLCMFAGALLFLALVGCAQNPATGSHDFVMLSEDSEIAIGRANHGKIIEQYGRYSDERLQAYVQEVGERLALVSHRANLHYRFTVLDSSVINAFALPGGYIYITRGLMAYLNSEAELAAVLGHEIGHVTARHGVRQQSAAQAANIGYTIGAILFPGLRAGPSQDVFNILGGALLSGYGRDHELESDGLGAEYLAKAGYEPKAMIEVLKVLKNQELFAAEQAKRLGQEPQGYHGLFASHPDNDTRLKEVVADAQQYATSTTGLINRNNYLSHIDGMVYGDSEQEGVRLERHFYHLPMKFALSFPEQWFINNSASRLQAIAAQGEAVIEMGVADINKKLSPEMFIKTRLNIDRLKVGKRLSINGLTGYTGLIEQQDQVLRVSVMYLRDQAFIFFATTKQKNRFAEFDSYFIETVESFHSLRESEETLAKGLKIHIAIVKQGDDYQTWSARSPITNSPITQLRLLNGNYPTGSLQAGSLAKQVR
jgi:predicted Zn-dependent protease